MIYRTCDACGASMEVLERMWDEMVQCPVCGQNVGSKEPSLLSGPPIDIPGMILFCCLACGEPLSASGSMTNRIQVCPNCGAANFVPACSREHTANPSLNEDVDTGKGLAQRELYYEQMTVTDEDEDEWEDGREREYGDGSACPHALDGFGG